MKLAGTLSFVALFVVSVPAQFAWGGGPVLSPEQIQAAIDDGGKYKTVDRFLEKGLKGRRVKLASSMALDGTSKYATFFNDRQAVEAEAAAANQQMRKLTVDEVQAGGLLHVFVEIHARGSIPASKMNRRYREQRAHLVLQIGDRIIQPASKDMIKQTDQSVPMLLAGLSEGKITLEFTFDVSPEDLRSPVQAILIDGDGNKHQHDVDLSGILDID